MKLVVDTTILVIGLTLITGRSRFVGALRRLALRMGLLTMPILTLIAACRELKKPKPRPLAGDPASPEPRNLPLRGVRALAHLQDR